MNKHNLNFRPHDTYIPQIEIFMYKCDRIV